VFLATLTTGQWQANCYVVAAPGVAECVIIDPGQDAAGGLRELLAEHQLKPKALLATHGHFDHVASAAQIADEYNVPLWIHSADRHLLTEPAAGLSSDGAAMLKQILRTPMVEPARVEEFDGITELSLARLKFSITHAPGHTEGSVLIGLAYNSRHPQINRVVFSGDVVFAGSVGRTDLPGGDPKVMNRTLSDVVLQLSDGCALLPGHGSQTTMGRERLENPYLQPAFLRN
jgi:glyoxylase-like metal-dependent hydrolase (beta-lactamase superfamily II)